MQNVSFAQLEGKLSLFCYNDVRSVPIINSGVEGTGGVCEFAVPGF